MNTDEKMTGDLFEVDKRLSLKPVVDFNAYLRSAFGDGPCSCIRCTARLCSFMHAQLLTTAFYRAGEHFSRRSLLFCFCYAENDRL